MKLADKLAESSVNPPIYKDGGFWPKHSLFLCTLSCSLHFFLLFRNSIGSLAAASAISKPRY